MTDLAQQLVEEQEGLRLTAYRDSKGLWTIGYGHLLDQSKDWTGYTITQNQAEMLLAADMQNARKIATYFPHYDTMNEVQQAALISMAFQLGMKPLHWPNFMAALQAKNYTAAKAAGLDSIWARSDSPSRAKKEMDMLEKGVLA